MPVEEDSELRAILELETVAVIGCSTSPEKDAHQVPKYLIEQGYEVIPVNPFAETIFGREAYDSLASVPHDVDIVDVFRPSEELEEIVTEAVERSDVDTIWAQLGIRDDEASRRAEAAGKRVVQDKCMKKEHKRLL